MRARKPLSEKSVALNILKWGTGGINIDASRIEYTEGRFPANIMFDDDGDEDWKRYFYCPKASKKEKGSFNNHPTIKPIALMEYLIRLITRPDGVVLDCFMGSGSTGVAANRNAFSFIGIEKEEDYFNIAKQRIDYENSKKRKGI